jgi:Protein of unknown function (DUF2793)
MPDNIQILKPGQRMTDANGDPYSGAVLEFYAAGTSTPLTVYSDYDLSTALGTSLTCDSGGYPTSDGNAKVQVYTGSSPYKVVLKDSGGSTIWSHDNIIGALDTSSYLTDSDVTPDFPVVNTSSNLTPAAADQSKRYNIDCSGGNKSVTHGNAADLGDGWSARYRHDGTANQILITGTSSELFKVAARAGVTAFALTRRGQEVEVSCDGVGFDVAEVSPPLFDTTGVILIADRLSTPPGSPQAGARYIVGSSPTGAWSGYAEHDIAESDGQGGWFNITPPSDCGWLAYVQDENRFYSFKVSAWVAEASEPATQAEQEAGADTEKTVTPGLQHYHPSAAKAWFKVGVSAGTPSIATAYNVTSVTDTGTGHLTVTIENDLSSANYCLVPGIERDDTGTSNNSFGRTVNIRNNTLAAGAFDLECYYYAGGSGNGLTLQDPGSWHGTVFGDL